MTWNFLVVTSCFLFIKTRICETNLQIIDIGYTRKIIWKKKKKKTASKALFKITTVFDHTSTRSIPVGAAIPLFGHYVKKSFFLKDYFSS